MQIYVSVYDTIVDVKIVFVIYVTSVYSVTTVHENIRNDFTNPSSESVSLGNIKTNFFLSFLVHRASCAIEYDTLYYVN